MGIRTDLSEQRGEPVTRLMIGQPSVVHRVCDSLTLGVDATERVVAEISEARQASYPCFRKMDPSQFLGRLGEDPYKF